MWNTPAAVATNALFLAGLVGQGVLNVYDRISTSFPASSIEQVTKIPGGSDVRGGTHAPVSVGSLPPTRTHYVTNCVIARLSEEYINIHIYGTFLKNITDNATLDYRVDVNEGYAVETGQMQFCDIDQLIEQPDPDREKMCPPEKGFALISIGGWLTWWIGAANYSLRYDVKTHEGERIYCLEADFYLGCRNGREPDCKEDKSPGSPPSSAN